MMKMRKHSIIKKIISLSLATVLAIPPMGGIALTTSAATLPTAVASLDFQGLVESGALVGNNIKASLVNSPEILTEEVNGVTTKVAKLEGTKGDSCKYIKLTAEDGSPLLVGKEAFSATFWVKWQSNTLSWPFVIRREGASSSSRYYVGARFRDAKVYAEKINGQTGEAGAISGGATHPVGEWHHMAIVADGSGLIVYVDGTQKTASTQATSLTEILGTNPEMALGYNPVWTEGSYVQMDEFRLYDQALTVDQVLLDSQLEIAANGTEEVDDSVVVNADLATLDSYMAGVTTTDTNLTLPLVGNNGSTITWATSDATVITADGVVTRDLEDRTATLTATVSYGEASEEADYVITVRRKVTGAGSVLPESIAYLNFQSDVVNNVISGSNVQATLVNNPEIQDVEINGVATKVAKFKSASSDSSHVQLTAGDGSSLLAGKEAVTVTFWERLENTNVSWPFVARRNGATKQRYYFGYRPTGTKGDGTLEKQNGSTVVSPKFATPAGWHHVALVLQQSGFELYINGEYVTKCEQDSTLPTILGDNPEMYLGYNAVWSEGSTMQIDEFHLYDGVLTEGQIYLAYEKAIKPTVNAFITAVEGSQLEETNIVVDELCTVAELKSTISTDPADATITIYRDETRAEVVADDEAIDENNVVIVSANECLSSSYIIKLSPKVILQTLNEEFKQAFAVWAEKEAENYSNITDHYVFPGVDALESELLNEMVERYNMTLQWTSGNRNVMFDNGRLNGLIEEDSDVEMTARLRINNDYSDSVSITVSIKAGAGAVVNRDAEVVDADIAALSEVMNTNRNKVVANNLSLLTRGTNGSTITWATSDPTVITETGAVTRAAENRVATLTATVTYGIASKDVAYEITVLKTNQAAVNAPGGGIGSTYPIVPNVSGNSDGTDNVEPESQITIDTTNKNGITVEVPEGYSAQYSINDGEQKEYQGKFELPVGQNQVKLVLLDASGKVVEEKTFDVQVKKPKAKVKVKVVKVGKRFTMKIANKEASSKIVYKTSNKKVANVSKKGSIKAKSKGTAVIKAILTIAGEKYTVKTKVKVK